METIKQQHLIETMRDVLVTHFGVENPSLQLDDSLDTLGLDSMGFVEYVFALESALNVSFPDMPRHVQTVRDFLRFVDDHTPDAPGPRTYTDVA